MVFINCGRGFATVGLGFAFYGFGFCSRWWGSWVAAFGVDYVDGGLALQSLHNFFFFLFLVLMVDYGLLLVMVSGVCSAAMVGLW